MLYSEIKSECNNVFQNLQRREISERLSGCFSFSEREHTFPFAICCRPSVCLSVVCLSVTLVHPTQAVQIFRNISTAFGTLAIH